MATLEEGEVFDVDKAEAEPKKKPPPPFRIYADSKVAVSRAVGKGWQTRYDAAKAAYTKILDSWEEVFNYYNNHQGKTQLTPRGTFSRGDSTENVVYSNVNVMLPAVYSKNPDITCNTVDQEDEEFCRSLEATLMTLFKKKDHLNAKPKLKKAAGLGLLTNMGVLKLDFVQKDDSREVANEAVIEVTEKLKKAKDVQQVEELYGQLKALEAQMEVAEPSGARLYNVLPHYLVIDPYAEMPDGTDGNWMMEYCLLPTEYLKARFTQKDEEGEDVLVYKATHKAVFSPGQGERDDGVGLVLHAIEDDTNDPQSFTDEERLSYLYQYMTECVYVWDKVTRRVLLFLKDDWTWPVWVWDDYLGLSRFFPYFVMSFGMSTGGTVSVGETSYYLDQQDEINDINRQIARIRRTIFDYFFYNSDMIKDDVAEPFFKALRGETQTSKHALGVKLGPEGDVKKAFFSFAPPSADYEALFNKEPILSTINRMTNTSDALRGVQFKTNTNEKAVETYQEAVKLSVGAKVDVVEDTVADIAHSLAEIAVQNYSAEDIERLVGKKYAASWRQMSVQEFNASYNLEIVAGSTEKPNSIFKKKEAVEVAQAVGQFAQAAPGTTLRIMLSVLERAFTEFVVKPEDWDALDAEIEATMQKGISTGAGASAQGQAQRGQGGAQQGGGAAQPNPEVEALLQSASPQVKQRAAAMAQQGASPQQVIATLKAGANNGRRRAQGRQPARS